MFQLDDCKIKKKDFFSQTSFGLIKVYGKISGALPSPISCQTSSQTLHPSSRRISQAFTQLFNPSGRLGDFASMPVMWVNEGPGKALETFKYCKLKLTISDKKSPDLL